VAFSVEAFSAKLGFFRLPVAWKAVRSHEALLIVGKSFRPGTPRVLVVVLFALVARKTGARSAMKLV